MIRDRVRKIAKGYPEGERIAAINGIDKRHAAWCATDAWTKDGGEYAKGLENWLAPTMQRYLDEPPAPKPQRAGMEIGKGCFSDFPRAGGEDVRLVRLPDLKQAGKEFRGP